MKEEEEEKLVIVLLLVVSVEAPDERVVASARAVDVLS